MNDRDREAIRAEIARWTREALKSPEAARAALMRTGMYRDSGTLKPEYGGPK